MKKTIVYYHPNCIKDQSDRGSGVRVSKMLEAFRALDHEVIVIAGNASTRHRKIRQLKCDVQSGLAIAYVYGESSNAPIMLADKRPLPSNSIIDYAFFSWLRKQNIPLGIFYRDVLWRFGHLERQFPWPVSMLLKPLYLLDWYMYDRFSDVLFLPSEAMNLHLPQARDENSIQALPPGFDAAAQPRPSYDVDSTAPLELLYVGGLDPSIYNISRLLELVAKRQDVKLTVCCRPSEWLKFQSLYEPHLASNIELVHANSTELAHYYHRADLFLMVMNYSEYMDFAIPVKFYESIGYCVPVIAMNYKEAASHIKSMDIGWVLKEFEELEGVLQQLHSNRALLCEKYEKLLACRQQCSWNSRAGVADDRLLQAQANLLQAKA